MAEVPSTRKVQITVPVADTSVIEWLDLQYSSSESVRRLIREAIAREGFVDVANRPVRPPASPAYVAQDFPADDAVPDTADPDDVVPATEAAPAAPGAASAPEAAPAETRRSSAQTRRSRSSSDAAASATIDDLLGL
ncbi:hypothetical protein L2X99_13850 [Microbacterium sp. KUDC0406]|uniref:hypothetical protein n=1 Tax=Microbacterium sp. KUDC0406 TaxID=2909588 RepID=UPI001F1AB041|nr:hypothetical protein [Microbacterium sp. KUDC0406]UJP09498.1 hypothetical protein L2X99_13850 [Microbacterium sp. KUDC0406]